MADSAPTLAPVHATMACAASFVNEDVPDGEQNERSLPLAVLDFGAVAHLPDGMPPAVGRLMRIAISGDADTVVAGLTQEGFIRPHITIDGDRLLEYLLPFIEPVQTETFHYSREWLRGLFDRVKDPRGVDFTVGLKLNLPPSYALIHRVWVGATGVMCQLDATVPARAEIAEWVPGFMDEDLLEPGAP